MSKPLIVFTTLGNAEQAGQLARGLVSARLAACVTMIPGAVSIYRWGGQIEEDTEILLMIKTTGAQVESLKAQLLRVHPYDVPEFLVVDVVDGGEPYLRWLAEATRHTDMTGTEEAME